MNNGYDLVPDDEPHDVSDPGPGSPSRNSVCGGCVNGTCQIHTAGRRDRASATIWGLTPRMVAIGAAVLALVITAIAVTGAIISSRSTDPGIAFCEAARDAEDDSSGDSEPWAFEDYRDARQKLADSRHEEIRGPALDLVDVAWQIDQLGDDPGAEVLPLAGEFTNAYSRFSGGCAQHGIEIPPMSAG